MSESSTVLEIDRSHAWNLILEKKVSLFNPKRTWDNPLSEKLKKIDLSQVLLLPLVLGGVMPSDLTQDSFNQSILKQLDDYQAQGYVLLDGGIVASMLSHSEMIPPLWSEITDSDSYDENKATIRFDGSVFAISDRTEEFILKPFTTRGHWGFGFGSRLPKLAVSNRDKDILSKEFTAVLPQG